MHSPNSWRVERSSCWTSYWGSFCVSWVFPPLRSGPRALSAKPSNSQSLANICRKRPFARKVRSEDEKFAISFAKPFAILSNYRKRQFVHKVFVHNFGTPSTPPPPNQQRDGFSLEFLLIKAPQTESRTLSQNCEQIPLKLRTNRITNKRAFLKLIRSTSFAFFSFFEIWWPNSLANFRGASEFLEDPNLLKLRSLDSSSPFFLSDTSIWGEWTQLLQMLSSQG